MPLQVLTAHKIGNDTPSGSMVMIFDNQFPEIVLEDAQTSMRQILGENFQRMTHIPFLDVSKTTGSNFFETADEDISTDFKSKFDCLNHQVRFPIVPSRN